MAQSKTSPIANASASCEPRPSAEGHTVHGMCCLQQSGHDGQRKERSDKKQKEERRIAKAKSARAHPFTGASASCEPRPGAEEHSVHGMRCLQESSHSSQQRQAWKGADQRPRLVPVHGVKRRHQASRQADCHGLSINGLQLQHKRSTSQTAAQDRC